MTDLLFSSQAVLGPKAKSDERNIVEIEAEDFDGNSVTQPLFSLKLGLNESVRISLIILTFVLIISFLVYFCL